jgi:hypothetical protein
MKTNYKMEENTVPQENQGYYYLPVYRVGEQGLVKVDEPSNIGSIRFVTGIAGRPSQVEVNEAKSILATLESDPSTAEDREEAQKVIQRSMVPDWAGILHIDLLKCLIADLNMRGPHNYGVAMAVTKLQEAAMWMGFKG